MKFKIKVFALFLVCTTQAFGMIPPQAHIKKCIDETERQFGLPKTLLRALIEQESSFNIKAINPVSESNAVTSYGLGQITLPTAKSFCGIRSRGELMSYRKNIKCTAKILRHHIMEYGSIHSALAAYRSGQPCRYRRSREGDGTRLCTYSDNVYIHGVLRKSRLKSNT